MSGYVQETITPAMGEGDATSVAMSGGTTLDSSNDRVVASVESVDGTRRAIAVLQLGWPSGVAPPNVHSVTITGSVDGQGVYYGDAPAHPVQFHPPQRQSSNSKYPRQSKIMPKLGTSYIQRTVVT